MLIYVGLFLIIILGYFIQRMFSLPDNDVESFWRTVDHPMINNFSIGYGIGIYVFGLFVPLFLVFFIYGVIFLLTFIFTYLLSFLGGQIILISFPSQFNIDYILPLFFNGFGLCEIVAAAILGLQLGKYLEENNRRKNILLVNTILLFMAAFEILGYRLLSYPINQDLSIFPFNHNYAIMRGLFLVLQLIISSLFIVYGSDITKKEMFLREIPNFFQMIYSITNVILFFSTLGLIALNIMLFSSVSLEDIILTSFLEFLIAIKFLQSSHSLIIGDFIRFFTPEELKEYEKGLAEPKKVKSHEKTRSAEVLEQELRKRMN